MGREQFQLKMHQRAATLLDLAIIAKNRKREQERKLTLFLSTKDWMHPIRLWHTEQGIQNEIDKIESVRQRVLVSYEEVMDRINSVMLKEV